MDGFGSPVLFRRAIRALRLAHQTAEHSARSAHKDSLLFRNIN